MKILIVDDESALREILSAFLSEENHRVRNAADGKEGLKLLDDELADVVISDVKMPVMGGLEFLKKAREKYDVPFIMITGFADMDIAVNALNMGACFFIHKPLDFFELKATLCRIQEKMELEHKLKQEQAKLIHMSRLADLGRMIAGIAHEINNPISFVADNVQPLKKITSRVIPLLESMRRDAPEENARAIDIFISETPEILRSMEQGCDRVASIVKSMSHFAGPTRESPASSADLNECVRDALQLVPPGGGVEVKLGLEVENLWFQGSKVQISQVVTNLLSNARDVLEGAEEKLLRIATYSNGSSIYLEVTDSGPGIPESDHDRIFTPFYTTKPPGKGTGLGLSICYGIVASAGGELSFRCPKSGGTTFTLRLPVLQEAAAHGGLRNAV
ncbi:MAG: response regulator [Gemmatimonadota bacterium]|nr:response regulator [Gemmatimonadota bacterium]